MRVCMYIDRQTDRQRSLCVKYVHRIVYIYRVNANTDQKYIV